MPTHPYTYNNDIFIFSDQLIDGKQVDTKTVDRTKGYDIITGSPGCSPLVLSQYIVLSQFQNSVQWWVAGVKDLTPSQGSATQIMF